MAYWHEPARDTGGWTYLPRKGSRVGVVFRGDVRVAPLQGHFIRYEGDTILPTGAFPYWKRHPEDWFELWPREPLLASSIEEAKAIFEPLLPRLEDGAIDDQFEKRPYHPPPRPRRVKEIEHATFLATAVIVQHNDGIYEVLYRVYAPDGKYFPVTTPSIGELGWEWGRARTETRTLADDPDSAEQIASVELNEIVQADPEIKCRE